MLRNPLKLCRRLSILASEPRPFLKKSVYEEFKETTNILKRVQSSPAIAKPAIIQSIDFKAMSLESISNIMSGATNLNVPLASYISKVNEVLRERGGDDFITGAGVSKFLGSLKRSQIKDAGVVEFLGALLPKINECTYPYTFNVTKALAGCRNLTFHTAEEKALLREITRLIQDSDGQIQPSLVSSAILGLKGLRECSEAKFLLEALAHKLETLQAGLVEKPANVLHLFRGLEGMSTQLTPARNIVGLFLPQIEASRVALTYEDYATCIRSLYNKDSNDIVTLQALAILTSKLMPQDVQPLKANDLAKTLYGLRFMSSEHPEVREVLKILNVRIPVATSWTPFDLETMFSSLAYMSADHEEVRGVLTSLTLVLEKHRFSFTSPAVGNILQGLRSMSAMWHEVRVLVSVLGPRIRSCEDDFNAETLARSFLGLSQLNYGLPVVPKLVVYLTEKLAKFKGYLPAGCLSSIIAGTENLGLKHDSVGLLFDELIRRAHLIKETLSSAEIAEILYGLRKKDPQTIRGLVEALLPHIERGHSRASENDLGFIFECCKRFRLDDEVYMRLFVLMTKRLLDYRGEMTASNASKLCSGLALKRSSLPEVLILVERVAETMSLSSGTMSAAEVTEAISGLNSLHSNHAEVGLLIRALIHFVYSCPDKFNMDQIASCLYSCKHLSSSDNHVMHLMKALGSKIASAPGPIDSIIVPKSLYGLRMISSDRRIARDLIADLVEKFRGHDLSLTPQGVSNALHGLKEMSGFQPEVLELVGVLNPMIEKCSGPLNGQGIGAAFFGMRHLGSNYPEVRTLIVTMTKLLQEVEGPMPPTSVSSIMYGMQEMFSMHREVRNLLTAVVPILESCTGYMTGRHVAAAIYGMKNLKSIYPEVVTVLRCLKPILDHSGDFDHQAVGNALFGLQNMSSDCKPVRDILSSLILKVINCDDDLSAQEIGNSLYGLQNCSTDHEVVREMVKALTTIIDRSSQSMSPQAIGNALFGMGKFTCEHPEVHRLLEVLIPRVYACKVPMDPSEIASSLYGLKGMGSQNPRVLNMLALLVLKIDECEKEFTSQVISNCVYSLHNKNSKSSEVRDLMVVIHNKMVTCNEPLIPQGISNCLYGFRSMNNNDPAVADLVREIVRLGSMNTEPLTGQGISNALFGMQHWNSDSVEVQAVLDMLAPIIFSSRDVMSTREISDAVYGLKWMKNDSRSMKLILSTLARKASVCQNSFISSELESIRTGLRYMTPSDSVNFFLQLTPASV